MDSVSKLLKDLLGPKGWITDDCLSWQRDWLDSYGESPLGVARPKSTQEIQDLMKICYKNNIPVVPQGGNTGLVGSGVLGLPGGIIISLSRMNKISSLDYSSATIVTEPGVVLENLHQYLKDTGLMFPMHLGSQGSAQIGGLIASNAGGSHAFRYGMMQDLVFGLEVVLADGSIWNGMRFVQKDNAGYQLRKIFCGSEGTLGIVTKSVLKLAPKPSQKLTALLAIDNPSNLVMVADILKNECGEFLSAMEFFSNIGIQMATENIPDLIFPLQSKSRYYFLIELSSCSKLVPLDSIFSSLIESFFNKKLISDGTIATSERQSKALWRLREEQPEGQKRVGYQLKHDISVPPGKLVSFLDKAEDICNDILSDVRINPFGHIGDGNIHYNLSPPLGKSCFLNLDKFFSLRLSKLANDMGGSFAAEHGIGRAKLELTDQLRGDVERNLMLDIKKSLDKKNNLNPGAVVSLK